MKMVLKILSVHAVAFLISGIIASLHAQSVSLTQLNTDDLNMPVEIASAGDERLFIVDQTGKIEVLNPDGSVNSTPFLDISDRVPFNHSQHGLLGLAFSPDYAESGEFYVGYIGEVNEYESTIISRFTVSGSDPDIADASSEEIIFSFEQTHPGNDHKAGCMKFGPDGYLYIATGDGGKSTNGANSQNLSNHLGKMLRLDVVGQETYAVPEDNPFIDETGQNEIWAYGLRNPWKFSFDKENGDLWIGDVGGDIWDEINYQPASGSGGENYGWPCYEADDEHILNGCDDAGTMTFPVADYYQSHPSIKVSVTGGFVYRGSEQSSYFKGHYIYAEAYSGEFFELFYCDGEWVKNALGTVDEFIVSFGEDADGELYASTYYNPGYDEVGNNVYKVQLIPPGDYEDGQDYHNCGDGSVDVNTTQQTAQFEVYPLPATDYINVKTKTSGVTYEITDLKGRVVQKGAVRNSGGKINIARLKPGMYILQLYEGLNICLGSTKIIK